ncbi:glycosyltransferase family 4 protein [Microbacterium sp. MPKO10]|uniref:glycosyltransferase family 4 protein n=1 Tax=Microbacterium sp. MPKO10 TaxID=2989818 RepID=UPI002236662D|nr:glycosyltransferase family 4 protein [Microbacterium sp. MPKO10]MCW4458868.1 glycosyltransferase family 4 protein [Microbacterium sp. MPKO10]
MSATLSRDRTVCPIYHVITPGDHFSPLTGSAIPTVVHGLATGARLAGDTAKFPQNVVVRVGTFTPRYRSANAIEFRGPDYPSFAHRAADTARARLGLSRTAARRYYAPAITRIQTARPGIIVGHNAPIVADFAGSHHHETVLYAHNDVFRTYSHAEAERIASGASHILCVSESLAGEIRSHIPPSLHYRIRVVPNGVDTAQFSPPPASETSAPALLRVLFLGRTIPEKGADTLVDAVALLPRDDLDTRIVGSHGFDAHAPLSAYERRLRERAADARSSIRFIPFVDRIRLPRLLQTADVLVVPSRWSEPSTLTIGEGLATGLVVIAARVGGIPEVIGDAGLLVSPDDPMELCSALARVASDRTLRADLRHRALTRSHKRDWEWAWNRFADVLTDIRVSR